MRKLWMQLERCPPHGQSYHNPKGKHPYGGHGILVGRAALITQHRPKNLTIIAQGTRFTLRRLHTAIVNVLFLAYGNWRHSNDEGDCCKRIWRTRSLESGRNSCTSARIERSKPVAYAGLPYPGAMADCEHRQTADESQEATFCMEFCEISRFCAILIVRCTFLGAGSNPCRWCQSSRYLHPSRYGIPDSCRVAFDQNRNFRHVRSRSWLRQATIRPRLGRCWHRGSHWARRDKIQGKKSTGEDTGTLVRFISVMVPPAWSFQVFSNFAILQTSI